MFLIFLICTILLGVSLHFLIFNPQIAVDIFQFLKSVHQGYSIVWDPIISTCVVFILFWLIFKLLKELSQQDQTIAQLRVYLTGAQQLNHQLVLQNQQLQIRVNELELDIQNRQYIYFF